MPKPADPVDSAGAAGLKLHAIIPAGGAGTRLWPLSRRRRPKFLLDLLGTGRSLLQETILRLAPISQTITVVTGLRNVPDVRQQIDDLRVVHATLETMDIDIVAEPSGRDSMPAIGLAAALIRRRYGADAVVGSFAADHSVTEPEAFREVIRRAIPAARDRYVVTVGIAPGAPSTAYGYIEPDLQEVSPGVQLVERFVEKPPRDVAEAYVRSGYLWNAGMFVMGAGTLLGALADLHPKMAATLESLSSGWDRLPESAIRELWQSLPKVAIDHAVAEPLAERGGVAVALAGDIGWDDVGDVQALAALRSQPADGSEVEIDSTGSFVVAPEGKTVALVGMDNVAVIDEGDALLIVPLDRAQEVKEVVQALQSAGREDLL